MIVIKKGKKEKTFVSEFAINYFVGALEERICYRAINESLYKELCYIRGFKEAWDDGTEMNAKDWVYVVKELYKLEK